MRSSSLRTVSGCGAPVARSVALSMGRRLLVGAAESSPGMRRQIAQYLRLPGEFGVLLQMLRGMETETAGMSHGCGKGHLLQHGCVSGLILNGARNAVSG